MTSKMELVVDAGGDVRCVYGEELDLRKLSILGFHGQSGKRPPRRAITSVVWTGFVEREPPGL